MKLETPKNANYCATVVRIKTILPLENCDNVVATNFFGFQAIVGKETKEGDLGIVFPAETQLSAEFCAYNNLFRHSEFNRDQAQKGYLEDNRRVRAVKFRGHRSSALFMPIHSLSYLNNPSASFTEELKEGDEFDTLNGHVICQKYMVPVKNGGRQHFHEKKKTRVEAMFMPEHFDTANYFRNDRNIAENEPIIITQKLHGTSIRIGHTIVNRKKTIRDRIAGFLGAKVQDTEYDYIFGSRKVIKDPNNPFEQKHFYSEDIWTEEGKKLIGLIPENFIVYGELVGYTPSGASIQTGYTYNCEVGTSRIYIYRVSFVNAKGFTVDLTWDQVQEFCSERGLLTVPELARGLHKDFIIESLMDQRYAETYADAIPLSHPDTVDEGVCIRYDRMTPYILKAKSPKFYEHETKLLDKGEIDMESADILNNSEDEATESPNL